MNQPRKTAEQSLLDTGTAVLFRVVDTHTELSPDKENVFVRADLIFEDDDIRQALQFAAAELDDQIIALRGT